MKYSDGTEARIGDKVKFSDGNNGVVVCSIDTNEQIKGSDHLKINL